MGGAAGTLVSIVEVGDIVAWSSLGVIAGVGTVGVGFETVAESVVGVLGVDGIELSGLGVGVVVTEGLGGSEDASDEPLAVDVMLGETVVAATEVIETSPLGATSTFRASVSSTLLHFFHLVV